MQLVCIHGEHTENDLQYCLKLFTLQFSGQTVQFAGLLETGQCHPYSKGSTVLLCCQLPTDFHNICIV